MHFESPTHSPEAPGIGRGKEFPGKPCPTEEGPGRSSVEQEIAERMGVGRTPVRQALQLPRGPAPSLRRLGTADPPLHAAAARRNLPPLRSMALPNGTHPSGCQRKVMTSTDWLFLTSCRIRACEKMTASLKLEEQQSHVDTKDAHRVERHGTGKSFVCCGDPLFTVK